jgi:hypothetical protein
MDGSRSWGKPKISEEAKRTIASIRTPSYDFPYLVQPLHKLMLRALLISVLEEGWRLPEVTHAILVAFSKSVPAELRTPGGELAPTIEAWARAVAEHELGPLWHAEDTKWMDKP